MRCLLEGFHIGTVLHSHPNITMPTTLNKVVYAKLAAALTGHRALLPKHSRQDRRRSCEQGKAQQKPCHAEGSTDVPVNPYFLAPLTA